MNRTYIFDVIDRHSVKSIELYEFQVFLRLRLWLTASCPIRRRAVVLDVLKFLANRCISCGLGQVRIRRGVRIGPWNRPNEIQWGWFCLIITWQHWFWRVNLMRIMMWRPGSVEFKPPVILLATCKVKLDDFKVRFRMPGRAGFGSWVCLRMSWAGVSVPQNSQLESSQWEQSHLNIYDTPFHPQVHQVHHHFPIFSLWNCSFLDIPWYPTWSDTRGVLSFSSEITFEAPSKADLHRRDEQWWAVNMVFTKKDPSPPWMFSAGPARSAAKVHLCIFSRDVEETLGTLGPGWYRVHPTGRLATTTDYTSGASEAQRGSFWGGKKKDQGMLLEVQFSLVAQVLQKHPGFLPKRRLASRSPWSASSLVHH